MGRRLRPGNRQLIRDINQSLVLSAIREQGPISRTAIARRTRLSSATVSAITGDLVAENLVVEHEAGASTGGRPPILLSLNADAGAVVGVKLTEDLAIAALTNLGADVIDQRAIPIPGDHSPHKVAESLAHLINDIGRANSERNIFGVGLGLAGAIDRATGICRFSPFFQWRDVPLRALLYEQLGFPVVIENDVNTLALAEQWFGAGARSGDFLVVTLGRGIGMGMILNGQLYRGGCGGGGEFGHVTVLPDGPMCDCGKRGCLETLVADRALLSRLRRIFGHELTLEAGIDLARAGDAAALAVFAAAGRTLGRALADLVNIFNPPLLIVGGEGTRAIDLMRPTLEDALRAFCFNGFYDQLRLVAEPWADDAWARGAAGLVLDELLRPPLYHGERPLAAAAHQGG